MPVTTASAAVHITPVVFKTFYRHTKKKGHKLKEGDNTEEATDDVLFDEAFHIVKAFIQLGTMNTIESLQAFTNTHVPAPFWATVVPVQIPLSSCNKAADALIKWFGPEDLKSVVGGDRWWQVRGLEGIDSEWITEKKYLSDEDIPHDSKLPEIEKDILRMEHLETVLLYIHGGAYFWGSINTHRYQVIRYARKIKGRAFAVNYRKAPQYPWPCPVQDVLAAYFYLTSPPPGAVHKPIPPSKIVFAGDSAGGGLCLTVLTVLRDLGLPLPAGAVLISPWVDLTHSFPSVMKNSATDIIPPHGFIHKPSTLWPVNPFPEGGHTRVIPTKTNPPPKPGHTDTLRPDDERLVDQVEQRLGQSAERGEEVHAADLKKDLQNVGTQEKMMKANKSTSQMLINGGTDDGAKNPSTIPVREDANYDAAVDFWEPKPPKVLMENPNEQPLELCSQIQIYATNEQLTHPLVSPILQGSLGNLCPLYILAGDGEVLRDEIIYMAHKAAHPQDYPAREGVLRDGCRQRDNAQKFQTPTKVHLQVYDGMCHVLTVFTFTDSAKYAYRSIAQFVKHVTRNSEEHLQRNPFPELHRPPSDISDSESDSDDESYHPPLRRSSESKSSRSLNPFKSLRRPPSGAVSHPKKSDVELYEENERKVMEEVLAGQVDLSSSNEQPTDGQQSAGAGEDIPAIVMIRERVDIFGRVRPMEEGSQIEALQLLPQEIGLIKEAPVKRWLAGQDLWDQKFKHTAERVIGRRHKHEAKAARLMQKAEEQSLFVPHGGQPRHRRRRPTHKISSISSASVGEVEADRRWGPLDLQDERPPPSALAGRKDTHEAVALLKKYIYHLNAPVTHSMVPKLRTFHTIRAAFDHHDNSLKAPPQSVSEQQVRTHIIPIHGVRMWQSLVEFFMRKSLKKAARGRKHVVAAIRSTGDKIRSRDSQGPDSEPQSST